MADHKFNPVTDTQEHIDQVTEHYFELVEHYDYWALQRAHFLYRIGDDKDRLLNSIIGMLK